MNVREERTSWRDERLSERHRHWGWDCPALDIDFLLIEYDKGKAAGLVEYKHEKAARQYAKHKSYQALIDLGNRAGLPVLVVRYADDFSWWRVVPLNKIAETFVPRVEQMTESEYVELLYRIRGYIAPPSVVDDLRRERQLIRT